MTDRIFTKFVGEVHNFEPGVEEDLCEVCGHPKESNGHPHIFRNTEPFQGCVCGQSRRGLVHLMTRI